MISPAAIWLTKRAISSEVAAAIDRLVDQRYTEVPDPQYPGESLWQEGVPARAPGKKLFVTNTKSQKHDFTDLMKPDDPLRKFVYDTLGDNSSGAYMRLPSGRSFYRAEATPSVPRRDRWERQIRTILLGEARPERARAIAERMVNDPELAEKIEQGLAGTRSISSIRLPRKGGGGITPDTVTRLVGRGSNMQGYETSVLSELHAHLSGSGGRKLPLEAKAKLIRDVGYTHPKDVEQLARGALSGRRDIYKLMRAAGFNKWQAIKAMVLPKDRRLALGLGITSAVLGGGIGAAKLLGSKKETAA